MEVISKELAFICEDLDGLLREADEERARDLQEGPSNSVVCLPPRVGSQEWRRLNGIYRMHPGPGRRDQRATCSHPYIRRDSTGRPRELWGPGEPGGSCQEIGLVALIFFFELSFSYVSSSISFYVSLANLSSIILFPYLLSTRDTQDEGEARIQFY